MCCAEPRCTAGNHGEGSPHLVSLQPAGTAAQGCSISAFGHSSTEAAEQSLAPGRSNHGIPTTDAVSAASVHCTLLQARDGEMHLNHVPSRDLLIAVCSRKL